MIRENLAPIALTMGDPAGIAPEITMKAHDALCSTGPEFFIVADPSIFPREKTVLIEKASDAASAFPRGLPVLDLGASAQGEYRGMHATAAAVIASIERATALTLAGDACAIVTNPIRKATLYDGGFIFPGHTEFLEALSAAAPMPNGRRRGAVMMIVGPELRTVPVTIHLSVMAAAASLTQEIIVNAAEIVMEALTHDFGISAPRLAISGLNPHAGEGGALGVEDASVIAPAVQQLQLFYGGRVTGPHAADSMFHPAARAYYDAALCMLHDQALIPAKTLAFHDAVNVTVGLPLIRTSPDHGVALDIAGKGVANAASLIAAIRLADRLSITRRGA